MENTKDFLDELKEKYETKSLLSKWWGKISLWWKFEGSYIPQNIKQGIYNLWYWFPVIWKDRNWDQDFIFEILRHKLSRQASHLKKYSIHDSAERDAEKIMTCVRLIDKVREGYYEMEYFDYHEIKCWFEEIPGNPECVSYKSEELKENFDDYFSKYPLILKKVLNGEGPLEIDGREEEKQIGAMSIGRLNHVRARKLLFKIMEQNIERWWD